jgi:hypothetical protein
VAGSGTSSPRREEAAREEVARRWPLPLIRGEQGGAASIRAGAGEHGRRRRRRWSTGGGGDGARAKVIRHGRRSTGTTSMAEQGKEIGATSSSPFPPRPPPFLRLELARGGGWHARRGRRRARSPTAPSLPLLAAAGTNCRRRCASQCSGCWKATFVRGSFSPLSFLHKLSLADAERPSAGVSLRR